MESRGKTQKELAEIVGVSAPTMNEWLKAKKLPRMGKIEILANYFGCEKSDLIEDKEKPTVQEDDGLTDNQRILMEFAKNVPDDKAEMILKVIRSIVEAD
jgi:transcriptional regulator with XRE-family HTH domain